VLRLYTAIDAVVNRAEMFARELASMRPTLTDGVHHALAEMRALVVEGTVILADVAGAYLDSLVTDGDAVLVADDVETIVALESACDAHKYEALQTAFGSCDTADALVVRELLLSLDAAMDAVEDAAEHLLSMQSVTN